MPEHEHHAHHPKSHTTTPRQKVWVIAFVVAAVILLGGVLFLSMGKSRIAFTWTPQDVEAQSTFTASTKPGDQDVSATFVSTSVDVQDTFTAETKATDTTTPTFTGKARGNVTITNRYTKAQPLQAGTRFRSVDGQIFRTQARVDVPVGGSVTTLVIADVAGEQGALKKGATFTIPGLWAGLQDKITGTAAQDFTGETAATSGPKLTATELANAEDTLRAKAATQAMADLQKLVPSGSSLHTGLTATSITKRTGPSIGDVATTYTLKLTVKVTGVAVEDAKVLDLGKTALTSALEAGLQLLDPDVSTFTFAVANLDAVKGTASVTMTSHGKTVPAPAHQLLQHSTYVGKSAAEVRALLATNKAVSNVQVQLSPFWVRSVPANADQLQLEVTRAQ